MGFFYVDVGFVIFTTKHMNSICSYVSTLLTYVAMSLSFSYLFDIIC